MRGRVEGISPLAKPIVSVFRGLEEETIEVFDILRPCPRSLIRNPFRKTALCLDRHRMILMTGAVQAKIDRRIVREESRLAHVQPVIRGLLIDMHRVISLTRISPGIGNTESGIPLLTLDREVVLHRIWNSQIFTSRLRKSDRQRTSGSRCWENTRKNDGRIVRQVRKARLVDHEWRSACV